MSADNHVGPRMGSTSRAGAYQFLALDTDGAVIDLSAWRGEYVQISWYPPDGSSDQLLHGFFATSDAAGGGFDVTTATGDEVEGETVVRVWNAPERLDRGSAHVTVPVTHTFLRVEASAGTGICLVRHAEA